MNLKEEVVGLLQQAKASDEYFNPDFLCALADALSEVYGIEIEGMNDWIADMWSR